MDCATQHGPTFAPRTLRCRSKTDSIWQQSRFPDAVCTAVDTGTAVISRKAARLCGRTASQLKAIVVDRYFETKREADAWSNAHSEFMMLRVLPAGARSEPIAR